MFNSPIAQLVERLAVNQEVRGSKPRRGASLLFCLGVAQQAARVFREHEVAGSKPATETTSPACAFGCGRSSTAEPRDVTPLTSVRFRSVTPKRMRISVRRELERQSTGLLSRLVGVRAPGDAPIDSYPSWRNWLDAPVSEAGAHGRVRSTRTEGTIDSLECSPVAQRKSNALIRRRSVDRAHPGQPVQHHQRRLS